MINDHLALAPAGGTRLRDNEYWGICKKHGRAIFRRHKHNNVCQSCQREYTDTYKIKHKHHQGPNPGLVAKRRAAEARREMRELEAEYAL